jgi:hypothetical protein
MATPIPPIQRTESQTSTESATIDQPSDQMVCAKPNGNTNAQPKPTAVYSSTTSQRPLVSKNREIWLFDLPPDNER